jgi:hypothetical protein
MPFNAGATWSKRADVPEVPFAYIEFENCISGEGS